jgi:hypothetical protein
MPNPNKIERAEDPAPEAVPANEAVGSATMEQEYVKASADAATLRLTIAYRERELSQLRSKLQETEAFSASLLRELSGTPEKARPPETQRRMKELMEALEKQPYNPPFCTPHIIGPTYK